MCKHSIGEVPQSPRRKTMKTSEKSAEPSVLLKHPYQSSLHSRRMAPQTAGQVHHRDSNTGSQKSRKPQKQGQTQSQTQSQRLTKMDCQNNNQLDRNDNAKRSGPRRISEGSPTKQLQHFNGNTASRGSAIRTSPGPSTTRDTTRADSRSPTQGNAYAGAKFSDPPSPKVLPKPPMHWFSVGDAPKEPHMHNCAEMTNVLKVMLKVSA